MARDTVYPKPLAGLDPGEIRIKTEESEKKKTFQLIITNKMGWILAELKLLFLGSDLIV